jgi:hypothetical protein
LTVTGHELGHTAEITDQAEALDWLYQTHFRKSTAADANLPTVTDDRVTGILDEAAILTNAMQVGGERFRKLFDGDFSDYPSQSEADLALANMLARATQDAATLDRLFRVSELYRPEKWDKPHSAEGQTYGQMTIAKALTGDNATKRIEAPASRSREFVRAADAMAVTHTVDWLIDGVMEKGTSCMLFGASGSGKVSLQSTGRVVLRPARTGTVTMSNPVRSSISSVKVRRALDGGWPHGSKRTTCRCRRHRCTCGSLRSRCLILTT